MINDLMRWTASNYLQSASGIREFGLFKRFLTDCTDYIIINMIIIEQKKIIIQIKETSPPIKYIAMSTPSPICL